MEKATEKTLTRLKAEGVRFARSRKDSKKPADKGWKDSDLPVVEVLEAAADDRFGINLLADSRLAVIDIDKPDEDHSKRLMDALDGAGVAMAETSKGFHYYIRRDADCESILAGRQRADIVASTRKNAAKIGDLLVAAAVSYELDSGEFKPVSSVEGLYGLLTHRDRLSPSERVGGVLESAREEVLALRNGDRNNGMLLVLWNVCRRMKQAGVGESWLEVGRELVALYRDKVNPEDTASFDDAHLKQTEAKVGGVEEVSEEAEGSDICDAVISWYLAEHEGFVKIDMDGSKDDSRDVYEWIEERTEWETRKLGGNTGGGDPSLKVTLDRKYSTLYRDITGKKPSVAKRNRAVEEMVTALKRSCNFGTPRSLFDVEGDREFRFRTGSETDSKVFAVNPTKEKMERVSSLGGNRPEYHLFATLGEVADEPSEKWESFLDDIFESDADLKHYFGQLVASAFVPRIEPRYIICNGCGGNGKNVLLDTLAKAVSDYGCVVEHTAFTSGKNQDHKRRLDARTQMVGKRLAVCTEADKTALDLKFIKALTSGDLVEIGGMFKPSSYVHLNAVPFVATNTLPRLFEVGRAVRRRVWVVPFNVTFGRGGDKPANPHLTSELARELPGVRRWLLTNIQSYLFNEGVIDIPTKVRKVSEQYMDSQRDPYETALEEWLTALPSGRGLMKIGRKQGKGRDAVFSGVMALVDMVNEHQGLKADRRPRPTDIKMMLSNRNIIADESGRLNCKPSKALEKYINDSFDDFEARERFWNSLFCKEPVGEETPRLTTPEGVPPALSGGTLEGSGVEEVSDEDIENVFDAIRS